MKFAAFAMFGLNLLTVLLTVGIKTHRSVRQRRLKARGRKMDFALEEFVVTGEAGPGLRWLRSRELDDLAASMVRYMTALRGSDRNRLLGLAAEVGLTERYVRRLRSRRRFRRARAAENLGYLGGPGVVEPLAGLLSDEDETVRAVAARSLARIGTPEAARHLARTLQDPSELTRLRMAENLERVGHPAVEPLVELLETREQRGTVLAAQVLGNLRSPEARPALGNAVLLGEHVSLRAQATLALGKIGDPADLPKLLVAAEDGEWPVRAQAANALRMIGEVSTIPALKKLAADREWWVRLNAARAIANLGAAGEQALLEMLEGVDRFASHRAVATLEAHGVTRRLVGELAAPGERGEWARKAIRAMKRAGSTKHLRRLAETVPEGEGGLTLRRILAEETADPAAKPVAEKRCDGSAAEDGPGLDGANPESVGDEDGRERPLPAGPSRTSPRGPADLTGSDEDTPGRVAPPREGLEEDARQVVESRERGAAEIRAPREQAEENTSGVRAGANVTGL